MALASLVKGFFQFIRLIGYLIITIITVTGQCVMSCNNSAEKVETEQYYYIGSFQFEDFGKISCLLIDKDKNIYLNSENGFLKIKKEMTTKISDSKYEIKSKMPSINFNETSSNINFVNLELNIQEDNLLLSGYIDNEKINTDLKGLKINIPSYNCGPYYIGDNPNKKLIKNQRIYILR
uniref:hypothetical protein n=1 Tax=Brachyspira catarrhinii TaxID=2528966 RepID=UPI003F4AF956